MSKLSETDEGAAHGDLHKLRDEWQAVFGSPPDKYLSPRFLTKALAWHKQCESAGGFPVRLRRRLRDLAVGAAVRGSGGVSQPPTPGSLLAREWNGRTYHVEVTADGFRFDGAMYPSLSPIARRITGTNWSGPRFFGLRARGKAE
jgi:hypothetical protein